jgi:hypothetical protein
VFDRSEWRVAAVLAAFEAGCRWADGWVPDPLPPAPGDEPWAVRARLGAAVGQLNRTLPGRTLQFAVVDENVCCTCVGLDGCDPGRADAVAPADGGRDRPRPEPEKTNSKKLMGWGYQERPVGAI